MGDRTWRAVADGSSRLALAEATAPLSRAPRSLAPGGVVVLHLSNRYLDLPAVVAALAKERGLAVRVATGTAMRERRIETATWAVVARREADLGALARDPRWAPPDAPAGLEAWTDDFSDLWSVLRL